MFILKRYTSYLKEDWNFVVDHSYNGIFQHRREFIELACKEDDQSIIVYHNETPCAVFPAIQINDTIISHPYLSTGGLIFSDISGTEVLICLRQIKQYYNKTIIFKRTPSQFHKRATEEDKWALFNLGAEQISGELSSFISPIIDNYNSDNYQYRDLELTPIDYSSPSEIYDIWDSLVVPNLVKYGTQPTHSAEDIVELYKKFPAYITGIKAQHKKSKKLLGALVIFKYNKCYHIQYSTTSAKGRALNALNILHCFMLKHLPSNIVYYNFGKSTEKRGTYLNESLFSFKKSFGSSSFIYETFKY